MPYGSWEMQMTQYVARTTQGADFNTLIDKVNAIVGAAAFLGPRREIIFTADERQLAEMKKLPEIVQVEICQTQ